MNKFLIAIAMIAMITPAMAGNKHNNNNQFENWQHNQTYNYNYNYKYKYKTEDGDWGSPYIWAPIIGGVVNGIINNQQPQYAPPPPPQYYEYEPCRAVVMPVYIPSLGAYRNMPVQVCN